MTDNKRNRSTSYPSIPLEESLKKLQQLKSSHGINGEFDRKATAIGMGYSSLSGSSARAVAALVQFGLLNRNKDKYSITDLGVKYLMPTEEGSELEAMRHSALNPPLIGKIFEEYKGQALPGQLKNILTITHGIQGAAADTALRVIKQSLSYAGLLSSDGIVTDANNQNEEVPVASHGKSPLSSDIEVDSFINGPSTDFESSRQNNFTEQGINLSGKGWQLTVLLKTTERHSAETRKMVRDLLAKADEVADELYREDAVG